MDEQAPTTTAPLEKPLTVLVADDHPLWRDALARDLADHGIDVVGTAGDGAEALRRVEELARGQTHGAGAAGDGEFSAVAGG